MTTSPPRPCPAGADRTRDGDPLPEETMISDGARAAADWLRARGVEGAAGAIVFGSGWSILAERIVARGRWPYASVPGLPATTVAGHPGEIIRGTWAGVPVIAFAGRWHLYEGRAPEEVALPAMIAALAGCRWLLCTNAAGGVAPELEVGDLVAVTGDLGLWGTARAIAPHAGMRAAAGPIYAPELVSGLSNAARSANVHLARGVLAMMPGPSYETAAEIGMLRRAGASVVSMSTVLEARWARLLGLRVAALSCVTNRAPAQPNMPLAHEDVLAALERTTADAGRLIERWLADFSRSEDTDGMV